MKPEYTYPSPLACYSLGNIKARWNGVCSIWKYQEYVQYLDAFKPVQNVLHEGYLFENILN